MDVQAMSILTAQYNIRVLSNYFLDMEPILASGDDP
jgi:hypothetical protein